MLRLRKSALTFQKVVENKQVIAFASEGGMAIVAPPFPPLPRAHTAHKSADGAPPVNTELIGARGAPVRGQPAAESGSEGRGKVKKAGLVVRGSAPDSPGEKIY